MSIIVSINSFVNGIVWGPYMLALLVGTGVFLTVRSGFMQFRHFGTIFKNTVGILHTPEAHKKNEFGVSPFQAVMTALASTVGTGNITGVATAIALGGPGAVFWMWISAVFGMMTKFSEVVLSVHFREKNQRGENVGGPMYYMETGGRSFVKAQVVSIVQGHEQAGDIYIGDQTVQLINLFDMAIEIIQGISASMGVILTVPFVSFIGAWMIANRRRDIS